jgi:hypothetical protein
VNALLTRQHEQRAAAEDPDCQIIANSAHDFAGAAPDLGDRPGMHGMTIEERQNLLSLPNGILDVVTGI